MQTNSKMADRGEEQEKRKLDGTIRVLRESKLA
jgi:hypothetical protein